eukprot:9830655-Prorocentrum_lima.AAC.1
MADEAVLLPPARRQSLRFYKTGPGPASGPGLGLGRPVATVNCRSSAAGERSDAAPVPGLRQHFASRWTPSATPAFCWDPSDAYSSPRSSRTVTASENQ